MPMRFGYATLRRFLCSMHYCLISTQNVIASFDISISIGIIIIIIIITISISIIIITKPFWLKLSWLLASQISER